MKDPLVSIIMRNFNEAWALPETLDALRNQEYTNWELIVIDSGSSDGSREIIREFGPTHFIEIPKGTYIPGKVLNLGMRIASSDLCIFLNADATPQNPQWLGSLVNELQQPGVGMCFGKQIPRPDCKAVFAYDYERCFGENRESQNWEHFFSMVSSGLRRDTWEKRQFREDLQYAEDDEYSRWCIKNGYRVEYVPDSLVMHSHNYTPAESYRRAFGDAKAGGQSCEASTSAPRWLKSVFLGWIADMARDFRHFHSNRLLNEFPYAASVRLQQRRGAFEGFKAGLSSRS